MEGSTAIPGFVWPAELRCARDDGDVRARLMEQRRRLERRLAGTDDGDPAAFVVVEVNVIDAVAEQVRRQAR